MLCFSFKTVSGKEHNNLYILNSIAAFIAFNKITVKRGLNIINGIKIDTSCCAIASIFIN